MSPTPPSAPADPGPEPRPGAPAGPLPGRPHVLLSAATSLDGCLDDASPRRLVLSGPEDFDAVDALRADCDAILAGANTLRRDDPRLLVRSAARVAARVAAGRPGQPLRVTVTASGDLPDSLQVWTGGGTLVYAPDRVADALRGRLGGRAEVAGTGAECRWESVLDDLGRRGVRRLLVEGGGSVHTRLVAGGFADEIRLAIAPVLVGDPAAPRFLGAAEYPGGPLSRMRLLGTGVVGDMTVLRLSPKERHP